MITGLTPEDLERGFEATKYRGSRGEGDPPGALQFINEMATGGTRSRALLAPAEPALKAEPTPQAVAPAKQSIGRRICSPERAGVRMLLSESTC